MSRSGDSRLVDWGLCQRIAMTIARSGAEPRSAPPDEVGRAAERAVTSVAEYTGLEPRTEIPPPETVDRAQWVRANVSAFRGMSERVEGRLAASIRLPEPGRSIVTGLTGRVAGAQVGLALGYVGRKVLGQYDVALIGPARPPRLLFVGPNLAEAQRRLGEPRDLLLTWIALHEATHAFQFASVPWLREHLGEMIEALLDSASVAPGPSELRRALRRLVPPPDPRRLAAYLREGGVVRLLAGPRQADILRRLQAAMSVVEGYSEHVMDAIGAGLDPGYARLRRAVDAERDRRGRLDAVIATLLGLDAKLRQYRLGKQFADAVAERSGIEGLNEVWRAPDALPDLDELEHPDRWVDRVAVG